MSGVAVNQFVDAMERRWTTTLGKGNKTSPRLRALWAKLCETLNAQITHGASDPWPVFPAECGAGKTRGLETYCSMLPYDAEHPGVLVVVQLTRQADEVASEINKLTSSWTAYAYHSRLDDPLALGLLQAFPVLVITHEAYERGLDALAHDEHHPKWKHLHRSTDPRHGSRAAARAHRHRRGARLRARGARVT